MEEEADVRDTFGKQQFNIYLPPKLVREIKHSAIDARRSLSSHVEAIFREYLARQAKEGEQ